MESLAVDEFGEANDPGLDDISMTGVELELAALTAEELDAHFLAEDVLGLLMNDFKLSIKVEVEGSEWLDVSVVGIGEEERLFDEREQDVAVTAVTL